MRNPPRLRNRVQERILSKRVEHPHANGGQGRAATLKP